MGGVDLENLGVNTLHIINTTSGLAFEGPPLPVDGYDGCAVAHAGFVYWVRGASAAAILAEVVDTAEVYRADVATLLP